MVTNTEEDRKVLPRQKKFIFYNIFGCGILMHESRIAYEDHVLNQLH